MAEAQMRIEIREFLEHHHNGDRATTTTPSSRFEVWQIIDKREVKLHTFDQYDPRGLFGPHVGNHAETKAEAEAYAKKFGAPISRHKYREKVQTKKTWVKV